MIYFLALIPATALTIAGYFALFLSTRMEGGLRTFGKYLGVWAFTLAALVVLGAIFAAAHGRHHGRGMHCMRMHGMHGPGNMPPPWHRGFGLPAERGPPPPPVAPGAPGAESAPPVPSNAPSSPSSSGGSPASH
jgi:hypothetical protein